MTPATPAATRWAGSTGRTGSAGCGAVRPLPQNRRKLRLPCARLGRQRRVFTRRICSNTSTACTRSPSPGRRISIRPGGGENFQAWIHAGFDNYLCTPNGMTHRLLTGSPPKTCSIRSRRSFWARNSLLRKWLRNSASHWCSTAKNEAEFGNPIADNESALRDEHFLCHEFPG